MFDESNISINYQNASNDTYLKVHGINSKLKTSDTIMHSSIDMDFSKKDTSMDINMDVYEDLTKGDERYEYVAPDYNYQNKLFTVSITLSLIFICNKTLDYKEISLL